MLGFAYQVCFGLNDRDVNLHEHIALTVSLDRKSYSDLSVERLRDENSKLIKENQVVRSYMYTIHSRLFVL